MNIKRIPSTKGGLINVIIETPKGSQNKYVYDEKLSLFRLKKTLPIGEVFPFDFGFIPGTKGGDGDPLDVLIIMEGPTYPGCLVECRVLGVLKAKQSKKGITERNDRIIALADNSILYAGIKNIKDLNESMIEEISNFFRDYNKHEGKKFKVSGWKGSKTAKSLVKKNAFTS